MTEKDKKILKKIVAKQLELSSIINDFNLKSASDLGTVNPVVRRGFVGFVADIFELTVPLSDNTKMLLPFNNAVMKEFRNTVSHQYGSGTNIIAYACLQHCTDKTLVSAIKNLLEDDNNNKKAEDTDGHTD